MKVFYSGFNLYQQFNKSTFFNVENFTEGIYDDCLDIAFYHTFSLVTNTKNEVMYHGCKLGKFTFPRELLVKQLACTDTVIILLSTDGLLFKLNVTDFVAQPLLPHIQDKFVKIAGGTQIAVALTQEGEVYNLPNKLNFLNKDIIDIKAGCEHCLLLCRNGDVFSFGCGSRGQLGHGNLEDEVEPQLIRALAGMKITNIATGGWHSCAVSAEGDIYIWGWNTNGQLALCDNDDRAISVIALPQVLDVCGESESVIKVACGHRHTVVLLDNGKLYGAGWNKYYQLGNTNEIRNENNFRMTPLGDFSSTLLDFSKVTVKCGPWSTAIIIH